MERTEGFSPGKWSLKVGGSDCHAAVRALRAWPPEETAAVPLKGAEHQEQGFHPLPTFFSHMRVTEAAVRCLLAGQQGQMPDDLLLW